METKTNLISDNLDGFIVVPATEANVFNEYMPKIEVAKKIFKELNDRFDVNKKGFVMDDISKNVGILSQCQCLQSLMSLALDFGLDFDQKDIIRKQKGSIREIMDIVIEYLINKIVVKDENGRTLGYKFDASPYDEENFSYENEISNIDSITWVIPVFCSILKYHASLQEPEICKWEDDIVDIIKYGLKYINKAFINGKDEKQGLTKGWNFTRSCNEPSLYFSFAVSECYLDFYNTFKDVLKFPYNLKNNEEYRIAIDEDEKKLYEDQKKKYEENRNKKSRDPKRAVHNTYNELVRIFKKINDISEYEEIRIKRTPYGELEEKCRIVASAVWGYVKDDLADNFFYNNLKEKLTEKEILMSTTSDALFNTVYIINIMIGGGLDESWKLEKERALFNNDEKLASDLQRDYDDLYESCQLAVQKAFRTYERLKNKSKDYIVDQFLIGFNEKFEEHADLIGNLRKLRMKCFSLLPLLIHTNTVISDYLVKFPQNNMKKYLEYIINSRYFSKKDEKHQWIWEKDGYFSGSNAYFIVALNEFYDYHEKYEKVYFNYGKDNVKFELEIRDKQIKELSSQGGDIYEAKAEVDEKKRLLEEKDAEIESLKAQNQKKSPVEKEIKKIVTEEIEEKIVGLISDVFANAAKALLADEIDSTEDKDGEYLNLYNSVINMIFAKTLSDYFVIKTQNGEKNYKFKTKGNFEREYTETKEECIKDLKRTIAVNVSGLINYQDADNKGEKKSPLRRSLEDKINDGK